MAWEQARFSATPVPATFSPAGSLLAAAGWDEYEFYERATAKVWDVRSGKEVATLGGHGFGVTCVTFSPDGRILATAGEDRRIRLWDTVVWQERLTLSCPDGPIVRLACSPDGATLAAGAGNGTVRLWRAPQDP